MRSKKESCQNWVSVLGGKVAVHTKKLCCLQGNGASYVDHVESKERNGAYVEVDSKQ